MADVNALSSALDEGSSELAAMVKSILIACIFFALWLGSVGWDLFYYFLWDIELIFTPGWASPVRALTRSSYLLSRALAFISLLLSLLFWTESWSEMSCTVLPFVYEGILVISYGFTLVILALRTLSLYPGTTGFDRAVQWLTALGLTNILVWGAVHVKEAGGRRLIGTNTRCGYSEDSEGLFLIRGMLLSTVIFNSVMFGLTCFKIYTSGSEQFFNKNTVMGTMLSRKSSDQRSKREPANQLAASLITQGLIAFFYLLVVDIVALACCIALTTDLYRQMTVISMAAFSSVLGGGLFRETYRAALSISATQQLEAKLKAREEAEGENLRRSGFPTESRLDQDEKTEDRRESPRSQSQATERSFAHPNWNSELEVSSVEHLDGSSAIRSSTESKDLDFLGRGPVGCFEQVPHLSHSESTVPHSANEPHPFIPYSNPTQASNINQSSLMMGLSLHAFDDGASSRTSSTLGEVAVLGAALPQWASANAQANGVREMGTHLDQSVERSKTRRTEHNSQIEGEDIEMKRTGPLPPPRCRKPRQG